MPKRISPPGILQEEMGLLPITVDSQPFSSPFTEFIEEATARHREWDNTEGIPLADFREDTHLSDNLDLQLHWDGHKLIILHVFETVRTAAK